MSMNRDPLIEKVETQVQSSDVVIYLKGSPQFPQCGFSARACEILRAAGKPDFLAIDVLADDPLWDALERFSQWPTVPQIFIHGKFVGGCDILAEMYETGELQELLGTPPPVLAVNQPAQQI